MQNVLGTVNKTEVTNKIIILNVNPIIDYSVRGLCTKPYYNHPKGCPNFGKKKGCPPSAELFDKVYDMSQPFYAIIYRFNLRSHTEKLKIKHPDWSDRQLKCCYYWQNTARKQLMIGIKQFLKEHRGLSVEPTPEAMGIDITKTLENSGFKLEWPPEFSVCKVAIAGKKIKKDCYNLKADLEVETLYEPVL